MVIERFLLPLGFLVSIGACAPSEGEAPEQSDTGEAASTPAAEIEAPRPMLAKSAWRSHGADGGVYVTFLDNEGQYRDFADGELQQSGTWTLREDNAICFLPEGEKVIGDCWKLGAANDEGAVIATHQSGRQIELEPIAYEAPAPQ